VIASLSMYDWPQMRGAIDRLWADIRDRLYKHGISAPSALEYDDPFWPVWESPDLVLSQTCGLPFREKLAGRVQLVGTPNYGLRDCPPGYYRSAFVVRRRDPRTALSEFSDACFVYNDQMSQSGWAAPMAHLGTRGLSIGSMAKSGSHAVSAREVAEGRGDVAALDAVTWEFIKRYEDCADNLRVLDWTEPTPGLPLITGPELEVESIRRAVDAAIRGLDLHDRRQLRIEGLVTIPEQAYFAVEDL